MPCQNIKTLKINKGKGLVRKGLFGNVHFAICKQTERNVKASMGVWEYGSMEL
jgi:hypothetical protein